MNNREQRVDIEAVGAIITNLRDTVHNDSSSDEGSMPGLQERVREDSPSSEGLSMSPLQERERKKILPVMRTPSRMVMMVSTMMVNLGDTRHSL